MASGARSPRKRRLPTAHIASATGEVWCRDMTDLLAMVQGRWFNRYLVLDL